MGARVVHGPPTLFLKFYLFVLFFYKIKIVLLSPPSNFDKRESLAQRSSTCKMMEGRVFESRKYVFFFPPNHNIIIFTHTSISSCFFLLNSAKGSQKNHPLNSSPPQHTV